MIAPHQHAVVYGPVKFGSSKKERLGTSLIIDPVPGSADAPGSEPPRDLAALDRPNPVWAVYTGHRPPSAGVIVTSAARRIIELSKGGEKIDNLVVMGAGDPTTHAEFKAIVENLRELRDKWFSKAKLTLFTSPLHLSDPEVRHAVALFDQPIVRFEWGTAKTFASMTGVPSTRLKEVLEHLSSLDRFIVQATFRKGTADNSAANEVKGWLKRVEELRPLEVQLSTVEATKKRGASRPVPESFLEGLAEQVRDKTGVPAQVFAYEARVA